MAPDMVFHLLIERSAHRYDTSSAMTAGGKKGACWQAPIAMPTGASWLTTDPDGVVRISSRSVEKDRLACLPIPAVHPPKLLLVSMDSGLSVNGRPAPPLTLLGERDEWAFEKWPGMTGHLVVFIRRPVTTIHPHSPQKNCPLCKTRLEKESRVYQCAACGTFMHMQGCEKEATRRLDCAEMTNTCPVCGRNVQLHAGYAFLPDHYTIEE